MSGATAALELFFDESSCTPRCPWSPARAILGADLDLVRLAMLLLCLSDIHGHLDALRAVLATAERRSFHKLLVAGDIVFPGPEPRRDVAPPRRQRAPSWCRA